MGVGESGRKAPGVFDQATRTVIIGQIATGSTRKAAAGAAWVTRQTLGVWCARGLEELDVALAAAAEDGRGLRAEDLTEHAAFLLAIEAAEAADEKFLVGKIRLEGEPKDLRWVLERRHREGWGAVPVKVEHSGSIDVKVVADARLSLSKKLGAHLGRAGFVPPDPDSGEGTGS